MSPSNTNNACSGTVCIVQLARKNKLLKSIDDSQFSLKATPADKCHYRCDPVLDGASLKKYYNRQHLAKAIRETPISLRVVEKNFINNRSDPLIDSDAHIKFSERRAFLYKLLLQVEQFYIRVLLTVSHVHHSSVDTAKYFADNAPTKAREIIEQGKSLAHSAAERSAEVASDTQAKANEVLSDAKHNAQELIVDGKAKVSAAKLRAKSLVNSGKASANEVADSVKSTAHEVAESVKETANEVIQNVKETAELVIAKTSAFADVVDEKTTEVIWSSRKIFRSASQQEIKLFRRSKPRSRTEEAAVYAAYSALLRDVEQNRQDCLNHVLLSEIHDCSKPFIPSSYALEQAQRNTSFPFHSRRQVLSEIKHSATLRTLNHVSIRDCSAPFIAGTEVKGLLNNDRKKLLSELQQSDIKENLSHVSETFDRSAPAFADVKIDLTRGNSKKALLEEVKAGVDLSKPSEIKDRSAPLIEAGVSAM